MYYLLLYQRGQNLNNSFAPSNAQLKDVLILELGEHLKRTFFGTIRRVTEVSFTIFIRTENLI